MHGNKQHTILESIDSFHNAVLTLDSAIQKVLLFLNEIQMISNGFSITSKPRLQANLENSKTVLRCQLLRSICSSTISSSLSDLQSMISSLEASTPSVLHPYLNPNEIHDFKIIRTAKETVDPYSMEGLKLALLELKLSRIWFLQRIIGGSDGRVFDLRSEDRLLDCFVELSVLLNTVSSVNQTAAKELLDALSFESSKVFLLPLSGKVHKRKHRTSPFHK
ncbi:hypothetical protein BDR26DRAFT_635149 [Obelidium mucronatum]|nr:hypothetical protein BDR26DRAFT_635149 [Obelidium mucronatum]